MTDFGVSNLLSGDTYGFKWCSNCSKIVTCHLTKCEESLDAHKTDVVNLEGMKTRNLEFISV